jgi:hypothetical protein
MLDFEPRCLVAGLDVVVRVAEPEQKDRSLTQGSKLTVKGTRMTTASIWIGRSSCTSCVSGEEHKPLPNVGGRTFVCI